MRPSAPVGDPQLSIPGKPLFDGMGWHLRSYADVTWGIEQEKKGAISADISFVDASLRRMGGALPDPLLSIFYFPWASDIITSGDVPSYYGAMHQILKGALTEHSVSNIQGVVERFALELLRKNIAGCQRLAGQGVIDIAEFAHRLAFRAISELLGLPYSEELERFLVPHLEDISSRAPKDIFWPESDEVRKYITGLLAGPADQGGLIDRIQRAVDDQTITHNHAIGLVLGCWAAGRETTASLICLVFGLIDEAGLQAEALANLDPDPEQKRWRSHAIVEALRFTPFPASPRMVVEGITTPSGQLLQAGTPVTFRWAAANRDPRVFGVKAHAFIPGRPNNSDHMGFGAGRHKCLGRSLGMVEAEAAIRTVYSALGELRLISWDREPGFADPVKLALFEYDLPSAVTRLT